jgi:hypothetical protein
MAGGTNLRSLNDDEAHYITGLKINSDPPPPLSILSSIFSKRLRRFLFKDTDASG